MTIIDRKVIRRFLQSKYAKKIESIIFSSDELSRNGGDCSVIEYENEFYMIQLGFDDPEFEQAREYLYAYYEVL